MLSCLCLSFPFPVLSLDRSWSKLACICHNRCLSCHSVSWSIFQSVLQSILTVGLRLHRPSVFPSPSCSFDIFITQFGTVIQFILFYDQLRYHSQSVLMCCGVLSTSIKGCGQDFRNAVVLFAFYYSTRCGWGI